MNVPFLDLKAQLVSIQQEIADAMAQVMESCAFAGGPFVTAFEHDFAAFCRCEQAVGVGSGTEALWLSLAAMGIGEGDEVITVPNTFIATAEAISFSGATPVFVDIDEKTYTMRPDQLEAAITSRTKALIPVHLFGQTADMDPILEVARGHGLFVIEDACQAHGAQYKGRLAGSIGDAGSFSFYPGKNLGAYGEAGAVVTNSLELAEAVRSLRDHGQTAKYRHNRIGWNGRMDGLQGAVLSIKLRHLPDWNAARIRHAATYTERLSEMEDIILPIKAEYAHHIFHIYAIRVAERDRVMDHLADMGVSCGIHYPVPVHRQQAYDFMGLGEGSFPASEKCARQLISLPMFPELTDEQIQMVTDALKHCLG